jgi:hypothetical protein
MGAFGVNERDYSKRIGIGQKRASAHNCDNASVKSGICSLYLAGKAAENDVVGDSLFCPKIRFSKPKS